ncbi:uncharacterized protein [Lepeophtheirus salmonis]|uniref:uncharacterized protein n=1 Tax=Lepeophtheirus salmonis TaxID=72036 RepID=UPI001AE69088|nr:uncharacterized protein LOC121124331 [Lepeophtheirus salmonis]
MKGYEWLNLVFVILFCIIPVSLEAAKHNLRLSSLPGMTSCTQEPSTIWLRNACHGGFVTLTKGRKKTKVIAQHRGIHQKSPKVELIKESCHDQSAGFLGSVTTRLYSPHADKYICFNQRGKVIAKSRKSIERMGPLCMFLERATSVGSRNLVQFQSSYNPEWYLGFDGKRVVHRKRRTRNSAHTLPRKMKRTRTHRKRRHRCDFSFSTGSFRSLENEFSGLIEHIRKQKLLQIHSSNNDKDFESPMIPKSTTGGGGNNIFVSRVSKTPAYYYIESNDERYKPEEVKRRHLLDEDEEDLLESKISFLNFKSNLKMYQLQKKTKSSLASSSSSLSTLSSSAAAAASGALSSRNNKKRKKKKLKQRRQKDKNSNLVVQSPSAPSNPSLTT